jgi:hypothetical protein
MDMDIGDLVDPHRLENLRRSIVMLPPGRPDGLDRNGALRIIEELQRLQRRDERYQRLVEQLRDLLAANG